jgi:hypothetical protein
MMKMPTQPPAGAALMQKVMPPKPGETAGVRPPTNIQGMAGPGGAEEKGIVIINNKPGAKGEEQGIIIVGGKPFMPAPQGASMGPGGAEEKGIIIINGKPFMPAPQGASMGPGGAEEKGIVVVDTKPGMEGVTAPTEQNSLNLEEIKVTYTGSPGSAAGNVETEFKVEEGTK